ALAWTGAAFAFLLTVGRFLIAFRTRQRVDLCEWFNGAAAIFLIAFFAVWQIYVPEEYRQAQKKGQDIPDKDVVDTANNHQAITYDPYSHIRMNILSSSLYWAAIYSVKASFLAMYWTIFRPDARFRLWWKISVVYFAAAFVATIMMRFTLCGHPKDVMAPAKCRPHSVWRNMRMGVVWCVLDGVGDIILTIMPLMMLQQLFLCRAQKIQLAVMFGLVGVNLATNIVRTYFTVDRELQLSPHLNAPFFILQGSLAVIICALPCYGSQVTRKKKKKHDGIRLIDGSGTVHLGLVYSMESLSANGGSQKDVDSPLSPPRAIRVRDDVKQKADSILPAHGDRQMRHSVSIWAE
ncbi:hypothetical protein BU23DRAFT_488835, partial [Bimuria novae-zelandiae CBS 107.79]